MANFETLREKLASIDFLPVIRTASPETALATVDTLTDAGVDVLEITATIDGWQKVIEQVKEKFPKAIVAAGTVITREQAKDAVALDVDFLLAPGVFPEAIDEAEKAGKLFVPGILTPTEIFTAPNHGIVKLFPASLGGPSYLKGLFALKPNVEVIPTGGIKPKDVPAWKQVGALVAGMGVRDAAQASEILAGLKQA